MSYDHSRHVLEAVAYRRALELAHVCWDPSLPLEDPRPHIAAREEIRETLLEEFDCLEGPELADLMDEALTTLGFPLEQV